ncbi:MAG: Hpt domain-containing protein [Myxococcota bacterium]
MTMQSPIDYERIEDATGGDREFLEELVDIFLTDAAERIIELREALASGEAESFSRTAHKLKGSSANMGAVRLTDIARDMENLGKSASLNGAEELMEPLQQELVRVRETLQNMLT